MPTEDTVPAQFQAIFHLILNLFYKISMAKKANTDS